MIYLIKSSAFTEDNLGYETILKIGYTGDNSKKSRIDAYLTENPTCQIIALIPEGDIQDEFNLHWHFREHKKSYGYEWFEECDEIYKFFKTHTTKESLNELENHYSIRNSVKVKKEESIRNEERNKFIYPIFKDLSGIDYIFKKEAVLGEIEDLEEYEDYLVKAYSDINFYEEVEITPKIKNHLENFNSFGLFVDKVKYFEDAENDLSGIEMSVFLTQIPTRFSDYYHIFGTTKLKALGYREIDILREWEKLKNTSGKEDTLKEKLYEVFPVGSRFSKAWIKQKLGEIYEDLGYNLTPKANDIEKYFNIKEIKLTDPETGKRDHGFEVINKK